MNKFELSDEELDDIKSEFLTNAKPNELTRLLLVRNQQGELLTFKPYDEFSIPYDQYADGDISDGTACDVSLDEDGNPIIECEENISGIEAGKSYFF